MSNINAHKPGYKHTHLGWIPEEWDAKPLEQLGKPFIGLTYTPEDVCDAQSGTLVLRSSNVQQGGLAFYDNVYVSCTIPARATAREGDILICVRNGSRSLIGKSALIDSRADGMAFGAFMSIFRSPINYYLHHVFKSATFQKEINKNIGATINQITSADLLSFVVPLPRSSDECIKIASILSTWDEAMQKTQQLIEQLKQRNKGLMQHLLTGKKRLKGFSGKWKHIKLRQVASEVSIKNKEDKELTVLSCTKYDGLVDSLKYFGRRVFSEDTSTYKVVPTEHFAYATNHIEEGSIGYQTAYAVALISPMYTVFKTTADIDDNFLYKVLKSQHYIHEYQKRMEGSIDRRGGLRWCEFSKIPIAQPALEEQIAIAKCLDKANEELKLYEQQLANLQEQKKGLMQKLLSGEVRVNT